MKVKVAIIYHVIGEKLAGINDFTIHHVLVCGLICKLMEMLPQNFLHVIKGYFQLNVN